MSNNNSSQPFDIKIYQEIGDISSIINSCNSISNLAKSSLFVVDTVNIISIFHLQVALHHALARKQQYHMKSKVLYDEVMLCLCASNRLIKAHSMFHINENTKRIAVITIGSNVSSIQVDNTSTVSGSEVSSLIELIKSIGKEISLETYIYEMESKSSSELERIGKAFDLSISEMSNTNGIEKAIITRIAVSDV
jgi:hypothetical protein